jgi:hypothetical protein
MTEPKRATWREFAAFMAARCSWPTTEANAMGRAVPLLRSKRDAQIAYAAAYGYGDEDFERDVAAWVGSLRSQDIAPPADPPSVADVLESVATEFEKRAVSADERKSLHLTRYEFPDAEYAEVEEVTLRSARDTLRAKAKEFT